jgi:uncharacterized protein YdhG (YjbR/CyaY superfamily)
VASELCGRPKPAATESPRATYDEVVDVAALEPLVVLLTDEKAELSADIPILLFEVELNCWLMPTDARHYVVAVSENCSVEPTQSPHQICLVPFGTVLSAYAGLVATPNKPVQSRMHALAKETTRSRFMCSHYMRLLTNGSKEGYSGGAWHNKRMTVIDNYLAGLNGDERKTIERLYDIVREAAPEATEELSYAMPAFKYKGKGLVAIMANQKFLSLYPFQAVDRLGLDLSAYECTSGSIHFSAKQSIPDELLRAIVTSRMRQIG